MQLDMEVGLGSGDFVLDGDAGKKGTASPNFRPMSVVAKRVTMHCQWGGKPENCPFPWDFVTLQEKTEHMYKKLVKIAWRYSVRQSDRQTQLITIK